MWDDGWQPRRAWQRSRLHLAPTTAGALAHLQNVCAQQRLGHRRLWSLRLLAAAPASGALLAALAALGLGRRGGGPSSGGAAGALAALAAALLLGRLIGRRCSCAALLRPLVLLGAKGGHLGGASSLRLGSCAAGGGAGLGGRGRAQPIVDCAD